MRFIQDNIYPLFATLAILATIICWFGAPEPAQPRTQPHITEPWSIPKPIEHDSESAIEAINARNLWGTVAAAGALKEPEWHVLGIATNGTDRFILLSFEGKPVEMLKTGDTLPDGAKILKIENNRFFVITTEKKKLVFGIYKNEPTK